MREGWMGMRAEIGFWIFRETEYVQDAVMNVKSRLSLDSGHRQGVRYIDETWLKGGILSAA